MARPDIIADFDASTPLAAPAWLTRAPQDDLAGAAFAAGAALAAVHPLATERVAGAPSALWRDRLALMAAEAGAIRAADRARAVEMRDQTHLLAPGERPGPAGAALSLQRRAAAAPIGPERSVAAHAALAGDLVARLPGWHADLSEMDPTGAAATALGRLLEKASRAERAAAVALADATLAAALGWPCAPPLLGIGLRREDLTLRGEPLRIAVMTALARAGPRAIALATDLARRAARLRVAARASRAKAAEDAVRLFLSQDAAAPQRDLSPVVRGGTARMSERAARRLCERLVALGALRELTGRPTHRLYGL
jgi:hypothetical protein